MRVKLLKEYMEHISSCMRIGSCLHYSKELLNQDWMDDMKLVERDENGGADLLANDSFSYDLGVHFLSKEDVVVDGYMDVV